MSRFTQYIGLSPSAKEFLNKHKHEKIASWKMTTGICDEVVTGDIYEVYDTSLYPSTWAEVEDVCPWSSGPMIHTALRNLCTGEVQYRWKKNEIHYQ